MIGTNAFALNAANQSTIEQNPDEIIIVSASRKATILSKIPATVSKIDQEQIEENFVTDIKDLVKYEAGVSVKRQPARFGATLGTTGRSGSDSFNIRGIEGNRVMIQVDGIRVPDGFSFGAQSVGRGNYLDLGLVKNVEILRGPNSALYGSDALAGAVSFTTSDAKDIVKDGKAFGGRVLAGYNSADDEYSESLVLAAQGDKLGGLFAIANRDFKELENMGDVGGTGSARTKANPQDGNSLSFIGKVTYDINENNKLRFTAENMETKIDANVLSGLSASVSNLTSHDTGSRSRVSANLSSNYDGFINSGHYGIYWQKSENEQFTAEDRTILADRERRNTFNNEVFGASFDLGAKFQNHDFLFGGDFSKTKQNGLRDGKVPAANETFPAKAFPDTDFTLAGLFLSDQIDFGKLNINAAIRYDYYDLEPSGDIPNSDFVSKSQSDSRFSPKIGIIYKFDNGFSVYGNWGQGYKAPEPSQVNQFFENLAYGYKSEPNPDLKPETNKSYEAGVRYVNKNLFISLAAFKSDYENFIEQVVVSGGFTPSNPAVYQFVNLSKVKINGLEARLDYKADNGIGIKAAASYADGTQTDDDGSKYSLYSVDPFKFVVGVSYKPSDKKYGGELSMTYYARKDLNDTVGLCSGECYRPDSSAVLDLTAYYKITENAILRAGIMNLADAKYSYWSDVRGLGKSSNIVDAYTQAGRNYAVSIGYKF